MRKMFAVDSGLVVFVFVYVQNMLAMMEKDPSGASREALA